MKRLSILALAALSTSCIDEDSGFVSIFIDPAVSDVTFVERGDDLTMQIDASIFVETFDEGTVHIQSAKVTTNVDGVINVFDDPDVVTEDFPIVGITTTFGPSGAIFEVPSPLADPESFEAHCVAANRLVTLDVQFYATQFDPGDGDAPPLIPASATMPLVPVSSAPGIDVFGSPALLEVPSQAGGGQAAKISIAPGADDDALVAMELWAGDVSNGIAGTYRVYRGDADSINILFDSASSFVTMPEVAPLPEGRIAMGGRASTYVVDVLTLDPEGGGQSYASIYANQLASPEYEALNLAALGRSPNGVYAAVQSAYPIIRNDEGDEVAPPSDKYYGSFLVELSDDLVQLDVKAMERDIVAIDTLDDGTTLVASTDLPPRTAQPTLRIERLDVTGTPLWTHDEMVLVYDPAIRPLPDGGVLVAYEEAQPGGRIEVLRLSGEDGSIVYQFAATGSAPSVAARPDGGAFVTFLGTIPGFDLPTRFVPLLLELSPTGEVVRAAQVACGGRGLVVDTPAGTTMLAGTFIERMTLGGRVDEVPAGEMTVSAVE
ncbi:MAG: hypothetical protein HOW73_15900 [Polyangiaceae bacterium]|nr:hypothetical protein [Polyangiaceae bacterium]